MTTTPQCAGCRCNLPLERGYHIGGEHELMPCTATITPNADDARQVGDPADSFRQLDDFEKWWNGDENARYSINRRQAARDGWNARQPVIDALRQRVADLERELSAITDYGGINDHGIPLSMGLGCKMCQSSMLVCAEAYLSADNARKAAQRSRDAISEKLSAAVDERESVGLELARANKTVNSLSAQRTTLSIEIVALRQRVAELSNLLRARDEFICGVLRNLGTVDDSTLSVEAKISKQLAAIRKLVNAWDLCTAMAWCAEEDDAHIHEDGCDPNTRVSDDCHPDKHHPFASESTIAAVERCVAERMTEEARQQIAATIAIRSPSLHAMSADEAESFVFGVIDKLTGRIKQARGTAPDKTADRHIIEPVGATLFLEEFLSLYDGDGDSHEKRGMRWRALANIARKTIEHTREAQAEAETADHACGACDPCENCGNKRCRGECLSTGGKRES